MVIYLGEFPPSMADVCESLGQTYVSQNRMDLEDNTPEMFGKAKAIMKEDTCMRFCGGTRPLYMEADVSGVELGAALPTDKRQYKLSLT